MIIEYHRPQNLNDALTLLARKTPITKPLAGGTVLSQKHKEQYAVVDLQALELGKITSSAKKISIGTMATLQEIVENPKIPQELRDIVQLESSRNLRNMGTLGGCIVTGDGRSMVNAALLCLNAALIIEPGSKKILFQDWIHRKKEIMKGSLITTVAIDPMPLKFACIRKAPKDIPMLGVFMRKSRNDILRIVINGNCILPFLLSSNKKIPDELIKIHSEYRFKDISKEYFYGVIPVLIHRLKEELS